MEQFQKQIPILYEDDQIMIVHKPKQLLSHPDKKLKAMDVLTTLKRQYIRLKTLDLAVVTRLDFNTSGLCLIAKHKQAHHLTQQIGDAGGIHKFYRCRVIGYLEKPSDTLIGYLLKDENSAVVRISQTPLPNTLEIRTKYRVLSEELGISTLEVELMTGKTHQIRAHFASINHPLVGDPLYGNLVINKKMGEQYQDLVMAKLSFTINDSNHPLFYLHNKSFEWNQ